VINWLVLTLYTYTVIVRATGGDLQDSFTPTVLFLFFASTLIAFFFFLAAVFGFTMLAKQLVLMFWKGML
jgi:cadmium resistance protein CadD (predicted permease)